MDIVQEINASLLAPNKTCFAAYNGVSCGRINQVIVVAFMPPSKGPLSSLRDMKDLTIEQHQQL
jgi:hypothetical protein